MVVKESEDNMKLFIKILLIMKLFIKILLKLAVLPLALIIAVALVFVTQRGAQ